jgi:ABC-type lipoprotein release transport system permease subunit
MKLSTSLPVEVLWMAFDSIRANKFRSLLTILGIVVGVLTAIVVASILTGMRQSKIMEPITSMPFISQRVLAQAIAQSATEKF